jgi:hypothetical protein
MSAINLGAVQPPRLPLPSIDSPRWPSATTIHVSRQMLDAVEIDKRQSGSNGSGNQETPSTWAFATILTRLSGSCSRFQAAVLGKCQRRSRPRCQRSRHEAAETSCQPALSSLDASENSRSEPCSGPRHCELLACTSCSPTSRSTLTGLLSGDIASAGRPWSSALLLVRVSERALYDSTARELVRLSSYLYTWLPFRHAHGSCCPPSLLRGVVSLATCSY